MTVSADSPKPPFLGSTRNRLILLVAAVVLVLVGATALVIQLRSDPSEPRRHTAAASTPTTSAPAPSPSPTPEPVPPAAPAPANLPVVDYGPAPRGFPADSTPAATEHLAKGLHPTSKTAGYDAPGGKPIAFLTPTIKGVTVTMPIVERKVGWTAVLLPSANRTVAWVPPSNSWQEIDLHDQLIVVRKTHKLIWLRDGNLVQSWPVSLGLPKSPTPLGRTFVLGRSTLRGRVYGGLDVLALGGVPDNPNSVPTGLRGAHIGIHTWYHDRELNKNTTDGCVRLTRSGHQRLLGEIAPGTSVVVIDAVGPADSPALQRA